MYEKINIHGSVTKHLYAVSAQLVIFLGKVLPSLYEDWWEKAVINTLSFQQQRRLEQDAITTLGGLDIAGLLRILDQNWYQISTSLNLKAESRHFLKEMMTIRNRWAHANTEGFSVDDAYRDLDTVQRFAKVIDADDILIQELQVTKAALLATKTREEHSKKIVSTPTAPLEKNKDVEFEPGQLVFVKSNPTSRGAVIAIVTGNPENRFKVFIDGQVQTFYTSQLQAEELVEDNVDLISCDQFHAHLTALQIRYPGLSTLYSLNAARIDFIPYQFRPVLRFIRSDRPRLLIADSVGVGKTIEAGLILRELQARQEVRSVLIICPRALVVENKWRNEMKRFEEQFSHLDGSTLRYCINEMDMDGVWPEKYQKVILPYSLFDETLLHGSKSDGSRKRKKGLLDLDPPPRFDLVIVDEAHHIRNQNTYSHKAVKFFCDHAEAAIFLTATPIQLGSDDLFVLLNTLRPDLIIDQESFKHMAEPNPFINQAITSMRSQEAAWSQRALEALDQAAMTSWGQAILRHNPNFNNIRSKLLTENITHDERIRMISDTESMHTFASIINRTRRRDIGNFTVRKPETVLVPFTPDQQYLHDEVLRIQAEIFSKIHDTANIRFMMTTIRRQTASCLFGLAPFLKEILTRHEEKIFNGFQSESLETLSTELLEEASDINLLTGANIGSIQTQIQTLLEAASSLKADDPKLEALRTIIHDKQKLPNNKIMLFSSFRHTLRYLFEHLIQDKCRVGLIHGGVSDEERVNIRKRFESSREDIDALDIVLFSEVGCEGLDYQFCDCMVNYDLPWNPMRIEQRIGRIDRNGQKSESVAIINLVTPGTVDADIYERCLMRIGVFNESLGENEEILGEITQEIKNIAESYTLSKEERQRKLQQLADNKIRLVQEQAELEQKQSELFGIRLPEEQIKKEIEDATSFWLNPPSIRRLVTLYLQRLCGKDQESILGEKEPKTLRLAQEARNALLRGFQQLPRQNTSMYRDWENWLKGGDQHFSITFDSSSAVQYPKTAFIMPLHPLVKQAALAFDASQRIVSHLKVVSNELPKGQHPFAIYQWHFHGIREDLVLQPIASSELIIKHLGRLLEQAIDCKDALPSNTDTATWDALDAQHYSLWADAKNKHQQHTRELAEYRRESLSTSHRARIALLEEQLEQASNEKIQKMRHAQITAAEADYARQIQDLEIAMEKADVIADPVAYGLLHIVGGLSDVD